MLIRSRKVLTTFRSYLKNRTFATTTSTAFIEEQKLKIGKWNINYLKVGNGAHPVLCMPGTVGSIWTDFRPQVEGLDRTKFTVVAWDPPGYGKSRPPERDFPDNFEERDADYAYELMKALEIPKFSLLGWSAGGRASLMFAGKYPEVVNKLVVWGTPSFISKNEIEACAFMNDTSNWSPQMKVPLVELYGEKLLSQYWSEWVATISSWGEDINQNNLLKSLGNIRSPTLILYGMKDPIIHRMHVSNLQDKIKGSRIYLYPDGKHNIHIAYSDDFNRRVQDFLLNDD